MKTVNYIIIFATLVFVAFRVYKLCVVVQYNNIQEKILDGADKYKEYELWSNDNRYILETKKVITDNIKCATFIIKNSKGGIIYNCADNYRIFDLKDIKWDSYNVIVESSDVGTKIYKYENGSWKK